MLLAIGKVKFMIVTRGDSSRIDLTIDSEYAIIVEGAVRSDLNIARSLFSPNHPVDDIERNFRRIVRECVEHIPNVPLEKRLLAANQQGYQ